MPQMEPSPMRDQDIAISVRDLTKIYKLYDSPLDRLKESLHPLRKSYHRDFHALHGVSFDIAKGETVGIIGKNGSGKSTLLKIITGVLSPSSGSVTVSGGKISALLELGAGFNPELTGLENVYFNAMLMGFTRAQVDERLDNILSFADIGDFIRQPVKTYSSGMFVRLAFAVGIASNPEIMIVDEALAVGDMNFQAKCMTALKRIQQDGATVLFVSHDIGALKSLCSRGIYLVRGKVKCTGVAGEVAEMYIRATREEMNAESRQFLRLSSPVLQNDGLKSEVVEGATSFKRCGEFESRVASFRYGSGGARITCAELLNRECEPVKVLDFNQHLLIRIHLESSVHREVSANYYILDDKKNPVMGSSLRLSGSSLLNLAPGEGYVLTFETQVPLREGNYSIQLEITSPVVQDETVDFLDVVDDALVFKVNRRPNGRIWAQTYVPSSVRIARHGAAADAPQLQATGP